MSQTEKSAPSNQGKKKKTREEGKNPNKVGCRSAVRGFSFLVLGRVGGVLLVLVLGDQVPHVLVGLLELHLVHALALIPVKERLAFVHRAELGGEALEDALQCGGVGDEGARRLVVLRGNLNDRGLLVVRDPL